MGQKVNPIGMRVGIIRDWESRWYAEKDFGSLLLEDIKIRKFLFKKLDKADISRVEIERSKHRVDILVRAAKPGEIIGQDGSGVEAVKAELTKLLKDKTVKLTVVAVANPALDATLVAKNIAKLLEQRQSFRTVQKKAIQNSMRAGAKGVKTLVSGRLGGNDIARSEGYAEGVVPLHTLRADIDFAKCEASTTYGRLGVKVWICRGEVKPGEMVKEPEAAPEQSRDRKPYNKDRNRPRQDRNEARPVEAKAVEVKVEAKTESSTEGGK
jgi:small subunit ribosomal protein S3